MEDLRVGLNLMYLNERAGGSGTYARELIRGMLDEEPGLRLTAFVSSEAPAWTHADDGFASAVEWVRFPLTITHGPPWNMATTMSAQWIGVPWRARRRRLDVVHGLANIAPIFVPGVATVVTVLDLIWIHYPKTMSRRATWGMMLVTPPSARRADRVIAISHAAKLDLMNTLRLRDARIDVTHLGFRAAGADVVPTAPAALRESLGLGDGPVLLCVAQKMEHKNHLGLIAAMGRLADPTARLVLPGAPTPWEAQLRAAAAPLGERVIFCDWLSAEDLAGLYGLAAAFVLASFEEGFGLPILEAMAHDTPVACSNCSSLPEVAGDAALLFDPHDPADIARALDRLIADPALRDDLRARGRLQAQRFPWSQTARATLSSYRRAIADRAA